MKKCKHNYKPIEFIRCVHDNDMRTIMAQLSRQKSEIFIMN